jgi:hypothetical protein
MLIRHPVHLSSTLVEKGAFVQPPKAIRPGSNAQSGPMPVNGPGSSGRGNRPGSFRSNGPGSWHEPGRMPSMRPRGTKGATVPVRGTNRDQRVPLWSRFMPRTGTKKISKFSCHLLCRGRKKAQNPAAAGGFLPPPPGIAF